MTVGKVTYLSICALFLSVSFGQETCCWQGRCLSTPMENLTGVPSGAACQERCQGKYFSTSSFLVSSV